MRSARAALIVIPMLCPVLTMAGEAARSEPPVCLTSYWRYWVTHRPPVLAEPYVDRKGRKHRELAPARGWHIYGKVRSISTSDAPAGYEKPDFDDSAWPVARMPICTGSGQSFWDQPLTARRFVGRARFVVPDPGAVRRLSLKIRYRGGVIVYVNGREVARGHLPAGKPGPDAFAEGYPRGAYLPKDKAEAETGKKLTYHGMWTGKIFQSWRWKNRPELGTLAAEVRARRDRSLSVKIPDGLLRKGVNVMVLDARAAKLSPQTWRWNYHWEEAGASFWGHLHLEDIDVRAEPEGAVRAISRPEGLQLWSEDVHRWILNADFLEPGVASRRMEIVAARNGTFSAQAVLGSSRKLTGLSAAVSELSGPGKIPASAVTVRWGVRTPLTAVLKNYGKGALRSRMVDQAIVRYAASLGLSRELREARRRRRLLRLTGRTGLSIFDHLSESAPAEVPAGSSQTVWVSVSVPADAAPGEYRGKLTVRAAGVPAKSLDLHLRVTPFRLRPAREWRTFAGIEESPCSVAKQYGLKPWSQEHWQRLDECMRWLGGLGNNFVKVPLLAGTEMGNSESMVVWVKKNGTFEYDWSLLDRYVGLARRHCGRPLSLMALVHPPREVSEKAPLAVTVRDGNAERKMALPVPGTPEFARLWLPFCKAFVAHVREKNLADSVHWGLFYDRPPSTLVKMAEVTAAALPRTGWMRSSHNGGRNPPFRRGSKARVDLDAHIRCFSEPDWSKGGVGRKGWARKDLNVLYPREASQVTAVPAYAPLWHLRELPELAITSDARGFTRMAADSWDREAGGWFVPAVLYILYPGKKRVEGSVQLEMLREGLQECEARIALEGRGLDAPVLKERTGCAWLLPGGTSKGRTGEFYGGWQERSRRLYEAAAGK
jgi:hypothetical protein